MEKKKNVNLKCVVNYVTKWGIYPNVVRHFLFITKRTSKKRQGKKLPTVFLRLPHSQCNTSNLGSMRTLKPSNKIVIRVYALTWQRANKRCALVKMCVYNETNLCSWGCFLAVGLSLHYLILGELSLKLQKSTAVTCEGN